MHILQVLLIFIPLNTAVALSNIIDKPDQDPFFSQSGYYGFPSSQKPTLNSSSSK